MSLTSTLPVARVRLAGRMPRIALIAMCVVLAASAVARTFAPAAAPPQTARTSTAMDPLAEARGLAERFAAAYLAIDPADADARTRRLRALGLGEVAAVPERPGTLRRRVTLTSTAAAAPVRGGTDVTVAAFDGRQWTYLVVLVRRTPRGLAVPYPPSLVGPPPIARDTLAAPEDEVQDPRLVQVVERALRHFVAGDRADLAADLAPRAAPSPPARGWQATSIDAVTWAAAPSRVAASVAVRGTGGVQLSLRYELAVVRRGGRWLVAAIGSYPTKKERAR